MDLGALGSGAMVARTTAGPVAFRRQGAREQAGRVDGGVVLYADAFPGGDALVVSKDGGVEELVLARSPETRMVYEVDLPSGWTLVEHSKLRIVEVKDERGAARLRVVADKAWGADGSEVPLRVEVRGNEIALRVEGKATWPVVVDPLFVGTGSMAHERQYHTATKLEDGKVLVVGGDNGNSLAPTEVYDPTSETFSLLDSVPLLPRTRHTATLLKDGRVLLAGGAPSDVFQTAEVYDPVTNEVTQFTMSVARLAHSATLLQDGRVLVAGGFNTQFEDTAELFDPVAGSFSLSKTKMPSAAASQVSVRLDDGKVLLVGGDFGNKALDIAMVYDPAADTFSTAKMTTARAVPGVARLADGRVLVTGGIAGAIELSSVEVYDPATGLFSALAAGMTSPRADHQVQTLEDGKVLLAGGRNKDFALLSAELYDPATGSFSAAPSMVSPRRRFASVTLDSGKVLLVGGMLANYLDPRVTNTAELHEPKGRPFSIKTARMTSPRANHAATTMNNGRVLLTGGAEVLDVLDAVDTAEEFDPSTFLFSAVSSRMSQGRLRHSGSLLGDGRVLVVGGNGKKNDLYDPVSRAFFPASFPMNAARAGFAFETLSDSKILFTGGYSVELAQNLKTAEEFDPATGKFSPTLSFMSSARAQHATTRLLDGRVLVTGGLVSSGDSLDTAELYNPASKKFSSVAAKMVQPRAFHTSVLLPDGRVMLAGGLGAGTALDSVELFDPVTETFSLSSAKMVSPRSEHTTTRLLDGKLLLAGGYGSGTPEPLASAEIYDPVTGTFSPTASPMAVARIRHGVALLADGKVLISGGRTEEPTTSVFEIYDPVTNSFSSPFSRRQPGESLTETFTGSALVVGGNPADGLPVLLSPDGTESKSLAATERSFHAATLLGDGSVLLSGGVSKDGAFLSSFEVFSPAGGSQMTGELSQARSRHTATRLPDGRVLVVGGENSTGPLDTLELWEGGQATLLAEKLQQPRSRHGAALLPDGRILIVGGSSQQGALTPAEIFDPASQKVIPAGQAKVGEGVSVAFAGSKILFSGKGKTVRFEPTLQAFLDLPAEPSSRLAGLFDGRALACGQECRLLLENGQSGAFATFSLLSRDHAKAMGVGHVAFSGSSGGLGWTAVGSPTEDGSLPPVLSPLTKAEIHMGEGLLVEGSGWPAVGAPGGAPQFGDALLLAWKPLDDAGPVHLMEVKTWGDGFVAFTVPPTVYTGPGWLYVIVNGVPSEGRLLTVLPSAIGQACGLAGHCASGFCVDGVCCEQACLDGCRACSKAKGSGEDGKCLPLAKGSPPRFGCSNPTGVDCGPTGVCAEGGICELPDFMKQCKEVEGGRCEGGTCKLLKGTCEGNKLVSPDKLNKVNCAPGLCSDEAHDCVYACQDKAGCAENSECIGGMCKGVTCSSETTVKALDGTETSCAPYLCKAGQCATKCESEADCASNAVCADGQCRLSCFSETTVLGGDGAKIPCKPFLCRQGACLDTCKDASDCVKGSECGCESGSECSSKVCLQGTCNEERTEIVALSGQASSCAPFRCGSGACLDVCQTTADCQEGSECREGKCESGCSEGRKEVTRSTADGKKSESCEPYLCNEGKCDATCSSHADCYPGYRCETDGQCKRASVAEAARDPGGCSLASPSSGASVRWVWGLAALAVLARRRRTMAA